MSRADAVYVDGVFCWKSDRNRKKWQQRWIRLVRAESDSAVRTIVQVYDRDATKAKKIKAKHVWDLTAVDLSAVVGDAIAESLPKGKPPPDGKFTLSVVVDTTGRRLSLAFDDERHKTAWSDALLKAFRYSSGVADGGGDDGDASADGGARAAAASPPPAEAAAALEPVIEIDIDADALASEVAALRTAAPLSASPERAIEAPTLRALWAKTAADAGGGETMPAPKFVAALEKAIRDVGTDAAAGVPTLSTASGALTPQGDTVARWISVETSASDGGDDDGDALPPAKLTVSCTSVCRGMGRTGAPLAAVVMDILGGASAKTPCNVPPAPAKLYGCDDYVAKVVDAFSTVADAGGVSLVTVSGPALSGKSAVVRTAAHKLASTDGAFPGGVFYADIHGVSSVSTALARVAGATRAVVTSTLQQSLLLWASTLTRRTLVVVDGHDAKELCGPAVVAATTGAGDGSSAASAPAKGSATGAAASTLDAAAAKRKGLVEELERVISGGSPHVCALVAGRSVVPMPRSTRRLSVLSPTDVAVSLKSSSTAASGDSSSATGASSDSPASTQGAAAGAGASTTPSAAASGHVDSAPVSRLPVEVNGIAEVDAAAFVKDAVRTVGDDDLAAAAKALRTTPGAIPALTAAKADATAVAAVAKAKDSREAAVSGAITAAWNGLSNADKASAARLVVLKRASFGAVAAAVVIGAEAPATAEGAGGTNTAAPTAAKATTPSTAAGDAPVAAAAAAADAAAAAAGGATGAGAAATSAGGETKAPEVAEDARFDRTLALLDALCAGGIASDVTTGGVAAARRFRFTDEGLAHVVAACSDAGSGGAELAAGLPAARLRAANHYAERLHVAADLYTASHTASALHAYDVDCEGILDALAYATAAAPDGDADASAAAHPVARAVVSAMGRGDVRLLLDARLPLGYQASLFRGCIAVAEANTGDGAASTSGDGAAAAPATALTARTVGVLKHQLAWVHMEEGDIEGALALAREAVATLDKVHTEEASSGGGSDAGDGSASSGDAELASAVNALGGVLFRHGDVDDALEQLVRAYKLRCTALGAGHPRSAGTLNNVANVLRRRGALAQSLRLYNLGLEVLTGVLGPRHADVAGALNNVGFVLEAQGDVTEALRHYEDALAIRESVLGELHASTAYTLSSIGDLLYTIGDDNKAHAAYERALRSKLRLLGPMHASTAATTFNLGSVLKALGRYEEAATRFTDAADAYNVLYGASAERTQAARVEAEAASELASSSAAT